MWTSESQVFELWAYEFDSCKPADCELNNLQIVSSKSTNFQVVSWNSTRIWVVNFDSISHWVASHVSLHIDSIVEMRESKKNG